jgi:hypothetical protein
MPAFFGDTFMKSKVAWSLVLCLFVAGVMVGCEPQKEVRTQKLVVVDSEGRDRVLFGEVEVDGVTYVGAVLLDQDGNPRVAITTDSDHGASVMHLDIFGQERVITGTVPHLPGGGMAVLDRSGQVRAVVGVNDESGNAKISMRHANGKAGKSFTTPGPVMPKTQVPDELIKLRPSRKKKGGSK